MVTVLSGCLARMARVRVTLCYAAVVAAVTAVMVDMTPHVQAAVIRHMSTNLHNLSHGRIATLVGSAFVVDAGPLYLWLPGLICLLAVAELAWGSGPLAIATVLGHVGASLLVAAGLTVAVTFGWIARSVAHDPDVGMSYVAMGALGVLTGAMPPRWRASWAVWWITVALVVIAGGPDFTDVGHLLALALGMMASLRSGKARSWTAPMVLLLAIGAAFGFVVLAGGAVSMVSCAVWGAFGALVCLGCARLTRQNSSADAASQSGSHDSGGSSNSWPGRSQS